MNRFRLRFPALVIVCGLVGGPRDIPAVAETTAASAVPAAGDQTVIWWRDGFPAHLPDAPWQRCVQTGCYGFVLDTASMQVPHLGQVANGRAPGRTSYQRLVRADNAAIAALPPADLGLFIETDGTAYRCTAGSPWQRRDAADAGPRLIESGRWVQRADVQGLVFTSSDGRRLAAEARFETIAWPDRLGLVLAVRPPLAPIVPGTTCFGRVGGGFGLDGTNHLEVPHAPGLDPEQFTLECWVYLPADHATATQAIPWIVCKNLHEETEGNYGLTIDRNGLPQARLNIGGGRENRFAVTARDSLPKEAWSHLALSYDGDALRLFVAGSPAGETRIGRRRVPGTRALALGRRQDNSGDGYHFRGAIDEIHIYDRPLSPEQIRSRCVQPEAPLSAVEPVFRETFRSDGGAVAARPRVVWRDAKLAISLDVGGTRLERRLAVPPVPEAVWHELSLWLDPTQPAVPAADAPVTVVAEPLDAAGRPAGDPLAVTADQARGWRQVNLDPVEPILPPPPEPRPPEEDPAEQPDRQTDSAASPRPPAAPPRDRRNDAIERVRLTVTNPTAEEQAVRLLFAKTAAGLRDRLGQPITGISAILRDRDGHPLGIPVQLSKNWHGRSADDVHAGTWFHGFTQLRLAALSTIELELTLAFAHWGGVPAASHAQLCLVGWGANQLWDESAVGSWGETICYEPDQVQAGCSILDVRPLLVTPMAGDRAWSWTNNVGGGDFFRLFDAAGRRVPHGRMKTAYERQGPCLTEVTYAGQVGAGIEHSETVSLARTDDLVRGVYVLRMDVHQPVDFARLVLFQIGADTYSSTGERKMAVGDATGLVREWATQWGGDADLAVEKVIHDLFPRSRPQETPRVSWGDSRRILRQSTLSTGCYRTRALECAGPTPWVSLHEAVRRPGAERGAWANRGIVIRDWRARLGGKDARPWVAEHGIVAGGAATSTLDIVPPPDVVRLLPGDFLEATIEQLVLPQHVEDYYGPNGPLRAALATMQDTWRLVHREAVGNTRRVEVRRGRLERLYPDVRVAADGGHAEFTIAGGLGFVPITVTGLPTHRGGFAVDGTACDQSVHGNDFWQTDHDATTGTWSQTVTVPLPPGADHTIRFTSATTP